MKKLFLRITREILFPTAALVLAAHVASAADVYVVHGIDGTDIGQAQDLPVDIEVDGVGVTALEAVPFGAFAGPLPLDTGTRQITIRLSDDIPNSFTGTVVADVEVNLAAFETAIIVAHLDINGTIKVTKFTARTADFTSGSTRVAFAHAAAAPVVDVFVRGTNGTGDAARLKQLMPEGQTAALDVNGGTYTVRVKPTFGNGNLAKLTDVPIQGANVVVVAVGTVALGTFNVIIVPVG